MKSSRRLTAKEWKTREAATGKSQAIMKVLEGVAASYGEQALSIWHFQCGLRDEKPHYRVKAISA